MMANKANQETTYTKDEVDVALGDMLGVFPTWDAPTITIEGAPERKLAYALQYRDAISSSSSLNVTSTSTAMPPGKKVYDFVQSETSSLAKSIYRKNIYAEITNTYGTGYNYFNISIQDTVNAKAGHIIYLLNMFDLKVDGPFDPSTPTIRAQPYGITFSGIEPVIRQTMTSPAGSANTITIQIAHIFLNNSLYKFTGQIFYTFINSTESSATTSMSYVSNPVNVISEYRPLKSYLKFTVPLEVVFSDTGAVWKSFNSTVVLQHVNDLAYWCDVSFAINDTIPDSRSYEMSIRMPFWTYELHDPNIPVIARGSGYMKLSNVSKNINVVSLYNLPGYTTRRYNMFFLYDNEEILSATTSTAQPINLTASVRYLCDITKNQYLLQL